ncbi:hypothetical protein [Rickettsiales endosymbiont of Stachyamoeba lipophora]|uniref:hypothetical protein n=1 Tax=Rickettsiales endosymbiont of Stachyamoeba lipophora TaxID=2486578 RepID=UPI000F652BAD|nr:hypothetical protein [Rickettsiales endosymbiont of Stachyamoeba lipophora]AZL16182.1 hypothetical protein EF513_06530 [Rickettsiales endosymbiont of Stachyamoeba lipophora]
MENNNSYQELLAKIDTIQHELMKLNENINYLNAKGKSNNKTNMVECLARYLTIIITIICIFLWLSWQTIFTS